MRYEEIAAINPAGFKLACSGSGKSFLSINTADIKIFGELTDMEKERYNSLAESVFSSSDLNGNREISLQSPAGTVDPAGKRITKKGVDYNAYGLL